MQDDRPTSPPARSRFKNRYPHEEPSRADFRKWMWTRRKHRLPRPPQEPILPVPPDLAAIHRPQGVQVTWISHSTVLLQLPGGINVLTDPVFGARASPLSFIGPKRHQPPGVALQDLPHIDICLISHNHYDHLCRESVRALYAQKGGPPLFMLPLKLDAWFLKNVTAGDATHLSTHDWWSGTAWPAASTAGAATNSVQLTITCCPVQHWSSRTLWDRNRTLWCGWALLHPTFSFFFTGDSGYSQDFTDIQQRFGAFDLAAIPIGAYQPRRLMRSQHVDPAEAVRIHQDLHAKQSLAIHWGTFGLADEPLDQPPKDLAAARQAAGVHEEDFFLLRHGETYHVRER